MNNTERRKQLIAIGVVFVFAALGGLGLWQFGGREPQYVVQQREMAAQERAAAGLSDEEVERLIAWTNQYVQAMQRRDCDEVIAMTSWMQDRLEYVRRNARNVADDVQAARDDLCDDLSEVIPGRDVIAPGGAEDSVLFRPLSDIEILTVDPGRDDLEAPSAGRVWVRVTYPSPNDAPRDAATGKSLKSLRVGVTFSQEGRVIKAGVIGNTEIDAELEAVYW